MIRLRFTGEDLSRIPKNERVFFVRLGNIHNTATMIQRWIVYVSKHFEEEHLLHATIAQQMLLLRLLSGSIVECWRVFESSFNTAEIGGKFEPQLEVSRDKLEYLRNYFRDKNALTEIRNSFAFHFDGDAIRKQLNQVDSSSPLCMYVSEIQGNSLYWFAEEITGSAMFDAVARFFGSRDISEANTAFTKNLIEVAHALSVISDEILALINREYLETGPERRDEIDLSECPHITEPAIPYFVHPRVRPESDGA